VPNIDISPALNPLEVLLVEDYMSKNYSGVTHYTMTEGNECIWVYYSRINMYFIFRAGQIHDIQID
jgi:hypothetical protein